VTLILERQISQRLRDKWSSEFRGKVRVSAEEVEAALSDVDKYSFES